MIEKVSLGKSSINVFHLVSADQDSSDTVHNHDEQPHIFRIRNGFVFPLYTLPIQEKPRGQANNGHNEIGSPEPPITMQRQCPKITMFYRMIINIYEAPGSGPTQVPFGQRVAGIVKSPGEPPVVYCKRFRQSLAGAESPLKALTASLKKWGKPASSAASE